MVHDSKFISPYDMRSIVKTLPILEDFRFKSLFKLFFHTNRVENLTSSERNVVSFGVI